MFYVVAAQKPYPYEDKTHSKDSVRLQTFVQSKRKASMGHVDHRESCPWARTEYAGHVELTTYLLLPLRLDADQDAMQI